MSKILKGALSSLRHFLATESPFYFTLKPLFILKMFKFVSLLFSHVENGLIMIRKIRLISKFITAQPGKQTNAMHVLPNISGSKDNQTIKFGQLIEYNMRNIFLEISYTKYGGETITRPFSEKSKLSIFLDQIQFVFIICQVEGYRNIFKLSGRPAQTLNSYLAASVKHLPRMSSSLA